MKIFPAIDIIKGQTVRLTKGEYGSVESYAISPVEAAVSYYKAGASNLHIVDLDGAKSGNAANFETIKSIASSVDMFIEVGGGIRDEARIKSYLECGVSRVILGTAAIQNDSFLREMLAKYGEAISVGVDTKNGNIATSGWTENTEMKGLDYCAYLAQIGVSTVIYTDIAKDGMLEGINAEPFIALSDINELNIIASGGVTTISDIECLAQIGVHGAIVGKALYKNKLTLEEILAVKGVEQL